ncbi:uncharacterized protein LOC108597502 [Drosophila busckii]|uniref:uncharacterized protein LOC108597502 n=1 Tax=Drosophila busckii TaxID=30019 RepID=UPI001432FDA7|nr:uncharacterized protein LOC108597502 [Drosophila busckii]
MADNVEEEVAAEPLAEAAVVESNAPPLEESVAEIAAKTQDDTVVEPTVTKRKPAFDEEEEPAKPKGEEGEAQVDGDGAEISVEELKRIEHEKRKKKRDERREADARLRDILKENEPEPEHEPEPKKKQKRDTETDIEGGAEAAADTTEAGDEEAEADTEAFEAAPTDPETDVGQRTSKRLTPSKKRGSEELATVEERGSLLLSGEYDRLLMGEVKEATTTSSDEEDHRRPCSVSYKAEFLTAFVLPSWSDISSELTEEVEEPVAVATKPAKRRETDDKKGGFVDATAVGEDESGSSKDDVVDTSEAQKLGEEEAEVTESSTSISFDWPFPLEDEPPPVVKELDDLEAFEVMFDLQASFHVPEEEAVEGEEMKAVREMNQIVYEFIFRLMDDVVEAAEYVDPLKVLGAKLDKRKMIEELFTAIRQHCAVKQFNTQLNSKMCDYYRRVGQQRAFAQLPLQTHIIERQRYADALAKLDHAKKKAVEAKKKNSYLMSSVRMDLDYSQSIVYSTENSFEDRVRKTLIRKDDQYLPRIVESELRRIKRMRYEISDCRLPLITRQHTLGRLKERMVAFEQITPELTMDYYLTVQREVNSLGIKVDERNADLALMHNRCMKHMHQSAFIREKISMLNATLLQSEVIQIRKLEKRNILRDKVLKLKLEHSRLKVQKSNLDKKSGLLYKPALLHDFDDTTDFVEKKRCSIQKLKRSMHEILMRISFYESNTRSNVAPEAIREFRESLKKVSDVS